MVEIIAVADADGWAYFNRAKNIACRVKDFNITVVSPATARRFKGYRFDFVWSLGLPICEIKKVFDVLGLYDKPFIFGLTNSLNELERKREDINKFFNQKNCAGVHIQNTESRGIICTR